MMENSSSSLADDDSSAEEYFDDDDTRNSGPSKIASRRRQQWTMGKGNGTGNFGGIRQQPPPLPSYARTASELFCFFFIYCGMNIKIPKKFCIKKFAGPWSSLAILLVKIVNILNITKTIYEKKM